MIKQKSKTCGTGQTISLEKVKTDGQWKSPNRHKSTLKTWLSKNSLAKWHQEGKMVKNNSRPDKVEKLREDLR